MKIDQIHRFETYLEMRSADEVFRLSYCGAHLVHPADEVLVPANVLGRRPAPVP